MSKLNGQWIEVFRTGDYGEKGKYSTADLDEMVKNYDPANHEAPNVVGHPEHDAPAYGWVDGVKREGEVLLARLKQVPTAFEEWVRGGLFKKRSISFYKDPLRLRHIGWLGAMPPHAKGLADVALHEFRDGDKFEVIEFQEEQDVTIEDIKKAISEAFAELVGKLKPQAAADGSVKLSDEQLNQIAATVSKKFGEGGDQTKVDELKAELKTLQDKVDNSDKNAKVATITALAEGALAKLKAAGKYIPAFDAMGVPQIFAELAKSETKISLGDKKTEKTALETFTDFLDGLAKIVPLGEISASAAAAGKGKVLNFTEVPGVEVDKVSVAFSDAAKKRAADKKITLGDAMKELRAEGMASSEAGSASASAV